MMPARKTSNYVRVWALLLLALSLGLFACGSKQEPVVEVASPKTSAQQVQERPQEPASENAVFLKGTMYFNNINKFGDVPLSLTVEDITSVFQCGDLVTVSFLDTSLSLPVCDNFGDVYPGGAALFARDTDGYARLGMNSAEFVSWQGLATSVEDEGGERHWELAEGIKEEEPVTITLLEKGGYRDETLLNDLDSSVNREDYPNLTDDEFANYRAVTTTGMGEGVLYRSSSPLDSRTGRASYADAAMRRDGIRFALNLADSTEVARAHEGYNNSYYSTITTVELDMNSDFQSAVFQSKLADGLRELSKAQGPYLIHCSNGISRTGFVMAMLECWMGASFDEVVADYMLSYSNRYGLTPEDSRYSLISYDTIELALEMAFEQMEQRQVDLQQADLQEEANKYLLSCGLTTEELEALRAALQGE